MPGSNLEGKPLIRKWLKERPEIKTIVDLGPGAATYAKLMGGDYIWKAVEIWGPYIKRFDLDKYYDEIRIGDIRYMEFPEGDCCIAGDVLEHLNREDFIKVAGKIDRQFNHVVVSVPINLLCDDQFEGNPFEFHHSYWTIEELDEIFPHYEKLIVDPLVYYLK